RHERQAPFGLLAKQAEIGRGVAETDEPQPGSVGPPSPDAPSDEMPRHRAQPVGVEIAQVDNVDGHGGKTITNAGRSGSAPDRFDRTRTAAECDPGTKPRSRNRAQHCTE